MRKHVFFLVLGLTLIGLAPPGASSQQAPAQKEAKDREEYDLYNNIHKETDANKKLQLLDQWKQKYADTAFKEERLRYYIQTYQQLGQVAKTVDASKELLGLIPDDYNAYYVIASMAPYLDPKDSRVLADGEKAGHALLTGLDKQFVAANKPANVSDADWAVGKKAAQIIAHQALGWVAMHQKKNDLAETEFLKTLELSPTAAQVSLWLGNTVRAYPEKNTLALFCFARAAAHAGPGALPPQNRQQMEAYITKLYNSYHGPDAEGLKQLLELAKASHLPPSDFKIRSKEELLAEKEEELKKNNPLLAMFLTIKDGLTGAEGAKFWEEMKGKAMPALRGTVVSITPPAKPKTLGLAMTQSKEAEILLIPETPIPRNLGVGAVIEFKEAEAVEFTPNPFLIKMQGGQITSGLPAAPAATTKKAPGKTGAKPSPKAKKK